MRVLLTRRAFDRFSTILLDGAPADTEWLCVEDDGQTTGAASDALAPADHVDVAWLSTDVLYSGALPPFLELLTHAPTLRWLQSGFAGLDFPVYAPLLERGVVVTNSHVNSIAIAEYVVGAVLRHYQRPQLWSDAQQRAEWRHHEFREIYGSRWLIVGFGAIGAAVAERVGAMGALVDGVRRRPHGDEPVDRMLTLATLPTALPGADVIVLALPATRATTTLVDDEFLARTNDGSVLVNVARGSLIDESALLRALERGRPEHAILDVFDQEPLPPDSALWRSPHVTITPHASAGGLGRHERNARLFRANLARFAAGSPLEEVITLDGVREVTAGDDVPAQFKR